MKTDEKWHYSQFTALLNYCSELVRLLCEKDTNLAEKAAAAKELESKADSIGEQVVNRLRSTKRLPFEKRTVFKLAHNIDNIVDDLEKAADRMKSYGVPPGESGEKMLHLLADAVEKAKASIESLGKKKFDEVEHCCARIKELESEADIIHRKAIEEISRAKDEGIAELLADPANSDGMAGLIRKIETLNRSQQIVGILEKAFDEAQDVADFIEELRYELE